MNFSFARVADDDRPGRHTCGTLGTVRCARRIMNPDRLRPTRRWASKRAAVASPETPADPPGLSARDGCRRCSRRREGYGRGSPESPVARMSGGDGYQLGPNPIPASRRASTPGAPTCPHGGPSQTITQHRNRTRHHAATHHESRSDLPSCHSICRSQPRLPSHRTLTVLTDAQRRWWTV